MIFTQDDVAVTYNERTEAVTIQIEGRKLRLDRDTAAALHECLSDLLEEIE